MAQNAGFLPSLFEVRSVKGAAAPEIFVPAEAGESQPGGILKIQKKAWVAHPPIFLLEKPGSQSINPDQ